MPHGQRNRQTYQEHMHRQAQERIRDPGISFLEFIELTARYRGVQSGCHYAEGFRHWRVWPGHPAIGLLP